MALKLAIALAAAGLFTTGGLFMKASHGLTRFWPTAVLFALFAAGAALNTLLVRIGEDVGPAYLAVVGCETVLAFVLGVAIYGERVSVTRMVALGFVVVGVLLLAADSRPDEADSPEPVAVEDTGVVDGPALAMLSG